MGDGDYSHPHPHQVLRYRIRFRFSDFGFRVWVRSLEFEGLEGLEGGWGGGFRVCLFVCLFVSE